MDLHTAPFETNFETCKWMSDSPTILRIEIVEGGFDRADLRIGCPGESEINGILVEHALVRW